MSIKNIYLARHGETTSNLKRTWRTTNEELTEKGLTQAKQLAGRLSELQISSIVASTAKRTMQTAKIVSEITEISMSGEVLFYEEKTPTSIQGLIHEKTSDNKIEQYIQALLDNSEDVNFHYEDEENLMERKIRIKKILSYFDGVEDNLCVITHGNILKMLAAYIILGPDCTSKELYLSTQKFKTANTGITKIICDNGVWRILIWNDHAHFAE